MTVRKYIYSKETGKMQEVVNNERPKRKAPYVIEDIKPYQVVGPEYGKVINSRSQHREYLRKHDLIEVGNERKYFLDDEK